MTLINRRILQLSLIISILSLAAGFSLAGHWLALLAFPAMGLYWLIWGRKSDGGVQSILFVSYIALVCIGVLSGISPYLSLIGLIAALVAWDLSLLRQSLVGEPMPDLLNLLENQHLQSLALAIGLGLLLGMLALSVRVTLPFYIMALMALLVGIGIERLLRRLWKSRE